MSTTPRYVVLGRGRWATRIGSMLDAEGRAVSVLGDLRPRPGESSPQHTERLAEELRSIGADVAWLCVAPGPHVPPLARAVLEADLHLIAEKPWHYPLDTPDLERIASERRLRVGVDFEFCLLDGVRRWAAELGGGAGLRFGGRFNVIASDRLGVPPESNLGSHLLAIREFAVPSSKLGVIECGYERPAARSVWLDRGTLRVEEIDFTGSGEPVVQRLLHRFEESALEGGEFVFDLSFAERVAAAGSTCINLDSS